MQQAADSIQHGVLCGATSVVIAAVWRSGVGKQCLGTVYQPLAKPGCTAPAAAEVRIFYSRVSLRQLGAF
jgi:hypothetical protein